MAADTLHMGRDILLQIVREKTNLFSVSAIFRANVYARLKLSFTFNPKGQNTERKRNSGLLMGLGEETQSVIFWADETKTRWFTSKDFSYIQQAVQTEFFM